MAAAGQGELAGDPIPWSEPSASEPRSRQQPSRTGVDTMRVLVVGVHAELARCLAAEGHDVAVVAAAAQAVARLEQAEFAAIVILAADSELSTLLTLRAYAQRAPIPILLILAQDTTENRVAGLDAGADDCVPPACECRELVARLHALARRRRTPETPARPGGAAAPPRPAPPPRTPATPHPSPVAQN